MRIDKQQLRSLIRETLSTPGWIEDHIAWRNVVFTRDGEMRYINDVADPETIAASEEMGLPVPPGANVLVVMGPNPGSESMWMHDSELLDLVEREGWHERPPPEGADPDGFWDGKGEWFEYDTEDQYKLPPEEPPYLPPAESFLEGRQIMITEETSGMNIALDLAGLIPGLGEFADAANAIDYARKGDYLFSALSLISMIPSLGDLIGKGGKLGVWATKSFPKGAKAVSKHGPQVAKAVSQTKQLLVKHKGTIKSLFDKLGEQEQFKEHLPQIKGALDAFLGTDAEVGEGDPEAEAAAQDAVAESMIRDLVRGVLSEMRPYARSQQGSSEIEPHVAPNDRKIYNILSSIHPEMGNIWLAKSDKPGTAHSGYGADDRSERDAMLGLLARRLTNRDMPAIFQNMTDDQLDGLLKASPWFASNYKGALADQHAEDMRDEFYEAKITRRQLRSIIREAVGSKPCPDRRDWEKLLSVASSMLVGRYYEGAGRGFIRVWDRYRKTMGLPEAFYDETPETFQLVKQIGARRNYNLGVELSDEDFQELCDAWQRDVENWDMW